MGVNSTGQKDFSLGPSPKRISNRRTKRKAENTDAEKYTQVEKDEDSDI